MKAGKLLGCKMLKQSDLPFDFEFGSCNNFKVPEEKALIIGTVLRQKSRIKNHM